MRHVDDGERRARLARRHALHPDHRLGDVVGVARAMTALHATEAAGPFLSVAARAEGVAADDVDRALRTDRTLIKQMAMRRTLFGLTRDLLPAAVGSAGARVAALQRGALARDVERHGVAPDGTVWLERARAAVLDRLAGSPPVPARTLREELPELVGSTTARVGVDGPRQQVVTRVLTVLYAEGLVVRAADAGHWRTSRPTWTLTADWLGAPVDPLPAREGYAELVRRWLRTFGPGTVEDVQWWLGSTKAAVRAALVDVGAVQVGLDGGATGWLLPDDLEPVTTPGPWAALLPTLDPTTMGWPARSRGFYLEPADVPVLVDTNGNAGTTAWWDGRVVGAWVQEPDGTVRVVLSPSGRDRVARTGGRDALEALEVEAARLTTWLDGVVVPNIYASQLMRGGLLP